MTLIPDRNMLPGYLAAFSVTLIWATWLVASRTGAQSSLTPYDLAALRYGVSAVVALPLVLYFKPWRTMSFKRIAVVSILLGPQYILAVFFGFEFAPAAHGGIFMNGALPAITLLISWIWLKESAHRWQLLGVVLIFTGTLLAAADVSAISVVGAWRGDLLFIIAGVFFAGYLVVGRLWNISTMQVLLCSSVVNAIYYVPIWFFFLPTGFADAAQSQILLQTLYQGLIPGLLGLVLVAYATRNIGASSTAAFMAAVPTLGTVLGVVFLSEVPGMAGWLSLFVLTPGILLVAFYARRKPENTMPTPKKT